MFSSAVMYAVTNVCCNDPAALTSKSISWNRISRPMIDTEWIFIWKVWLPSSWVMCCVSKLSRNNNISFIIVHHLHIRIYQLYSSKRRGSINKSSAMNYFMMTITQQIKIFFIIKETTEKFRLSTDDRTSEIIVIFWNINKTRW